MDRERTEKKREKHIALFFLLASRAIGGEVDAPGCVIPSSRFSSYLQWLFIAPALANSLCMALHETGS